MGCCSSSSSAALESNQKTVQVSVKGIQLITPTIAGSHVSNDETPILEKEKHNEIKKEDVILLEVSAPMHSVDETEKSDGNKAIIADDTAQPPAHLQVESPPQDSPSQNFVAEDSFEKNSMGSTLSKASLNPRFKRKSSPRDSSNRAVDSKTANVTPTSPSSPVTAASSVAAQPSFPEAKEGTMRKQGQRLKAFKERYFVLKKGILQNFANLAASKDNLAQYATEEKQIELSGSKLSSKANLSQITLVLKDGKTIVFEQKKQVEFMLWQKALQEHIDYANGVWKGGK